MANNQNVNTHEVNEAEQKYQNYNAMVTNVQNGIENLEGVCKTLDMGDYYKTLRRTGKRMQNRVFRVGIMGEFRRGKSTVINALLGEQIVPSDVIPCTATLNTIRYDVKPRAEVNFKDGHTQKVDVEELSDYITKEASRAEKVEDAVVYYPCQFCQNGVEIIDTPGLNDDERMTSIATKVLPTLDAIIMVLVPDAPFSASEAEFVRNKVMTSDLGRIIFVVNKIDTLDEEDVPRVLHHIKKRIAGSVLEKTKDMYTENSKEYNDAKNKLADIRMFPLSARNALKGKMKGDRKLLEESGQVEFEVGLSKLLVEERGLLELLGPVNSVLNISNTAQNIIETRLTAANMNNEEFTKIKEEEQAKLDQASEKKTEEIQRLKAQAKNLYSELEPQIQMAYENIEQSAYNWVDNVVIDDEDVKNNSAKDETAKRLAGEMVSQVEHSTSAEMEKLFMKVQYKIAEESESVQKVVGGIAADMEKILEMAKKGGKSSVGYSVAGSALGAVSACAFNGVFAGVGGLIEGYKVNGVGGALVGGGLGMVGGIAAGMAALSLGVVGLPVVAVIAVASTLSGKFGTRLIFRKKIREKNRAAIKSELRETVEKLMAQLKKERIIENWLRDLTEKAYSELAEQLDREMQDLLESMQKTMTNIQLDIQKNEAEREKFRDDMLKLNEQLIQIQKKLKPIRNRLVAALNCQE